MVVFGLWGAGGHLAPPLDDTFIHLQYASQLAGGHALEYNTGDLPSSGESSFVYPFILAPAFLLGLDGIKALIYTIALGMLAHVILVLFFYRIAFDLGGRGLALLSTSLLLLDGPLNWSFASGMETGLYTAALVVFFWAWLQYRKHGRIALLATIGAFIALLRPEGHILVSIACLLILARQWRRKGFTSKYLWLLLPPLVGIVPYLANLMTTGQWQFNTATAKSVWYLPYTSFFEKASLTVGYGINAIKNVYMGFDVGRSPFPLLALPVVVFGAGIALRTSYKFFHSLMLITLGAGITMSLLLPPLHFNRYLQPYDPIFWLYFAIGIISIVGFVTNTVGPSSTHNSEIRPIRPGVWAITAVVLLMLPQFVGYFFTFADSTRDIYYQQMTFSDWVRKYTPKDARIAVNDVGAHKYLSDRYTIDLIGLTDNRLRGAYFGGWGSIYDVLVAMPEKERPKYLLIHPALFSPGVEESVSQSFLQPLYSIRIQFPTITAGDTEALYKVSWEYALLDPITTYLLHKGEKPLDALNVGALADEAQHSYKIEGKQPSIAEPKSIASTSSYEDKGISLTESGRRHSGWEEFTMKSVPGKSLTLVARSLLNPDASQRLLAYANGQQVGLWEVHNDRGRKWQEYEYTIPAQFIRDTQTTIRIDTAFDPGGPGFPSYRYWTYAP